MAAAMKTYASRCFVNFVGLRNILSLNIIGKSQIPSFFIVSACRTQLTPTFCLSCKALSTSSSVLARQRFREEYHVTVPELEENPMEVNDVEQTKDVLQKVTEEACAIPGQLFAVVHLTGRQLKVTTNDLVVARGNFPPDIGERICLEKVTGETARPPESERLPAINLSVL
ncbi:PREDICTED: uncharacterized protein LOC106817639 [Priapulus caudatus]|uniref:Uncharacterized protein LOC106817639 n=1 Tax=Priapulus caudatus TaxID=37621 RepID=A0ABM1F043_PRICU|nr:PREDICTED: uncharacterized protein LOC106817639 [Priapulus caudatus]